MAWATGTVLAVVGIVAAVAGAGVGAYSAQQQGKAAEAAGKFNEAVQKNNALAAQQQATYEADRIRRRNRQLLGQQSAAIGKSGIDFSGSAADVVTDSAVQGELDALAALYTGKVRSNSEQSGAMLSAMGADNARATGYYTAAGSLLSGAGSAASGYSNHRANQAKGPSF